MELGNGLYESIFKSTFSTEVIFPTINIISRWKRIIRVYKNPRIKQFTEEGEPLRSVLPPFVGELRYDLNNGRIPGKLTPGSDCDISFPLANLKRKRKLSRVNFRKGTGKNWPIADRCVPSNDPRNNCGTYSGSSSLAFLKWRMVVFLHTPTDSS